MGKYEELEELQKQKETCKITEEEFESKKKKILTQDETLNDKKVNNGLKNKSRIISIIKIIIKLALYIAAVVIVVEFFDGADSISSAGSKMMKLQSVSGNTVAESYYNYYGSFIRGLATAIKALGVTCGIVVAYIGNKIK